ncbi:MAG: AAA family ATPase, partial [Acidobacteriota bacterium]
ESINEQQNEEGLDPVSLRSRLIADNLIRFTGNIFLADSLRDTEDDEEISSRNRNLLGSPSLLHLLEVQECFIKRKRKRAMAILGLLPRNHIEASLSLGRFLKLIEKLKILLKNEETSSASRRKTLWIDSALNTELAGFILQNFRSEVVSIDSGSCNGYYLKSPSGELMPLFPFFIEVDDEKMGLFDSFFNDEVIYVETETGKSCPIESEEVLQSFAEFMFRIGLYTKASDLFKKVRTKEGRETILEGERACECALNGYRLYQSGDFEGAVREFSRAVRLKPELSQIYIQLSLSLAKLNEMDEAISVLRRLVERNPFLGRGHELMGDMYHDKGDFISAEAKYMEALRLDPGSRSLQRKLEKAREKASRRPSFKSEEESIQPQRSLRKIEEFMEDMTQLAEMGKYHPAIEREDEIRKIIHILNCSTKNNPLLIGEPGVGKTAIVEGLVLKAIKGELPSHLARKRFYLMNVATLLAGTKYRGQFEERILDLLKEIKSENCIVFIDNIHNIISSGLTRGGSLDTSALLKPALIKGDLQVIGATTYDEYQNNIEKDLSLSRCFQRVNIAEPSPESIIRILLSVIPAFEEHHSVIFSEKAVRSSVELIRRYVKEGFFPDKALDILDRAAALVATQVKECARFDSIVSEKEILEAISAISGIPLSKIQASGRENLVNLEATLGKRVIGQAEAIKAVSKIVRSSLLGFKLYPQRPNAIFLFVGPTGVGKTELCKALTDALFGDEDKMLRIDMSEYMERISSTRLIGSSPGYVGYSDQNQLTDKIRQNPYTVILLDEMEKADVQMINLFLQVFDAGRLTDGRGRTVNFNSSIIIMTSNIGTELYFRQMAGYGEGKRLVATVSRSEITKEVRKHFSPEFLNRIDEIVFFKTLTADDVKKIAILQLKSLNQKLRSEGKVLTVTEKALDIISREGYSYEFGARNLGRIIREMVLDRVAQASLDEEWDTASRITIDEVDGHLKIEIS